MTGDQLEKAAVYIFGERGWISALSSFLGVHRTQIWRYVRNNSVPGPVAAAVSSKLELTRLQRAVSSDERKRA